RLALTSRSASSARCFPPRTRSSRSPSRTSSGPRIRKSIRPPAGDRTTPPAGPTAARGPCSRQGSSESGKTAPGTSSGRMACLLRARDVRARDVDPEGLQRTEVDLREGRERLDGVEQHVERQARPDRKGGLLQPLPRLGAERVRAGQPLAV